MNLIQILTTLFILISAGTGFAADVFWINPENGNWNTPGNWSTGAAPTAGDDVFINVDGTYNVTINSSVSASSITVGGGEGAQTLVVEGVNINNSIINHGIIKSRRNSSFSGSFENRSTGKLIVQGISGNSSNLTFASGFTNHGLIDLTNNSITYSATLSVTDGTLVNQGTIRVLPGVSGGSRNLYARLNNHGTLQIDHNLDLRKNNTTHSNNGTVTINSGKTLKILGGGSFRNDSSGVIQGSGVFNTSTSSFVNNGHIKPGSSTGTLAITGGIKQNTTSSIDIEINGTGAGTGHDQLKISGSAALGGILNIKLADGYTPQNGDTFQILSYGSHSGNFTATTPALINSSLDWNVSYNGGGIQLEAVEGSAGLRLHATSGPNPVELFEELTYTLTVANNSTTTATNVSLVDTLPPSVIFSSATATQGTCSVNDLLVTCNLGDIGPMGQAVATIKVKPTFLRTIRNIASVSSDTDDPYPNDNTATLYTTVNQLPADFNPDSSPLNLAITGLSMTHHSHNGETAITISGIGFNELTRISLVLEDGTIITPTAFTLNSEFEIVATFDLEGAPTGNYGVKATNGTDVYIADNSFEVIPPQPNLETRLILPRALGRHAVATIYVEYENTGNASMVAPLLKLVSTDEDETDRPILTLDKNRLIQNFWSDTMPSGTSHSVQFLATGDGDSPGILEPGESGRVAVYYLGLLRPWDFSDRAVEMEIRIIDGDDPTPFGWALRKDGMQPETMPQEAWDLIFNNLSTTMGETWGDYVATLSENAAYLNLHADESISSTRTLMQYELLQAMGHSPITTLSGATDLQVPAPGMSLSFGRIYPNSLDKRFITGALGKGWSHTWDIAIEEEVDGNVVLTTMKNRSRYTKDIRGGYFTPTGNFSTLTKDGDIFTITAPSGRKTVFTAAGQLDYVEDLNNNRITALYSGNNLTRLTHSNGSYLSLQYDGAGKISSVCDDSGNILVSYAYTGDLLTGVEDTSGLLTQYGYHQAGQETQALALVRFPDSTESVFNYDAHGRLSEITFNNNSPVTIHYDIGSITLTDTATSSVQTHYYDSAGRFVKYIDPDGHSSLSRFDGNHNLISASLADGTSVAMSYDTKGNLTRLIDQQDNLTKFNYGANSRMTGFVNAESVTTRYGYDVKGNNTTRTSPDNTLLSFQYNAAGSMTALVNRRGTPTTYTRDSSGRVSRITSSDHTFVAYNYDPAGNLTQVEDVTGITTLDYTVENRLERITYPHNRYLEYTYDIAGRRSSMVDHAGNQTNYHYDPDGNLESITNNAGELQAQYSYDNSRRLARRTLGNGIYTEYGYDTVSRLIHVATYNSSSNQVSAYAYSYDVNSRRTGVVSQDGSWAYSYDATGQLTGATFTSTNQDIPSTTISYDYDAVGNRMVKNVDGTSVSYTSNALNQYSAAGNFSYSYDNDGNLVARTNGTDTWSYTYDELNRLVSSTSPEENKEYIYNGLGQLAQVITDGVATYYITDPIGLGNLVGEYDDNGDLAHRYTHGLGLLAKNNDFYTFDGNGNTSELTDSSGQILNYYVYTPFGKVLYDVEDTDNDFEFVGQFGVRHMNSDFTYMRNRFYMPSTGRFYSEDPIGLAGGDVSFYRYVSNDPVNFVDPWGLKAGYLDSLFNVDQRFERIESNKNYLNAYQKRRELEMRAAKEGIDMAKILVDPAVKSLAENYARDHIGPVTGAALKRANTFLGFFDPFPSEVHAPTCEAESGSNN